MAQILLIEDDLNLRTALCALLELAGHKVAQASDGEEGAAEYRRSPADLVITDLYMPNREGLETIMDLRRDFPGVAIIAMSGRPTATTMLGIARRVGAIEILQKPFGRDELLAAVSRAISARSRSG